VEKIAAGTCYSMKLTGPKKSGELLKEKLKGYQKGRNRGGAKQKLERPSKKTVE